MGTLSTEGAMKFELNELKALESNSTAKLNTKFSKYFSVTKLSSSGAKNVFGFGVGLLFISLNSGQAHDGFLQSPLCLLFF